MNRPHQPHLGRPLYLTLAFLLVCLACVFFLPYHVPVAPGGVSDAYVFGWNSKAGLLSLLAASFAFALFTRGMGLVPPSLSLLSENKIKLSKRWLWLSLAVSLLFCGLEWFRAHTVEAGAESTYFLSLYEEHRLGGQLYKTFTFYYGPVLFYSTIWTRDLIRGLSLGDSYFLSWTVQFLLGMAVLWKVVELSLIRRHYAWLIYLLIAVPLFGMLFTLGLNYTPLRFVSSALLALLLNRAYLSRKNPFLSFPLAALAGNALLFYSPELGTQFFVATALFFSVCKRTRLPGHWPALLLFIVLMSLGFFFALRLGEFTVMQRVSKGGINFPLIFSATTLVPILVFFAGICVIVAAFLNRSSDHPLIYLILLSVISSPAAMGRCDPGHLIVNTIYIWIAVLVVLADSAALFRFAAAILLAFECFVCLPLFLQGTISVFWAPIRQTLIQPGNAIVDRGLRSLASRVMGPAHFQGAVARWKTLLYWQPAGPLLPAGTVYYAPLGAPIQVRPLFQDPKIDVGFFPGILPLYPGFIADKLKEMDEHSRQYLILPEGWMASCEIEPQAFRAVALMLFKKPSYIPYAKNQPMSVGPICRNIQVNFALSPYASPLRHTIVYAPLQKSDTQSSPTF